MTPLAPQSRLQADSRTGYLGKASLSGHGLLVGTRLYTE